MFLMLGKATVRVACHALPRRLILKQSGNVPEIWRGAAFSLCPPPHSVQRNKCRDEPVLAAEYSRPLLRYPSNARRGKTILSRPLFPAVQAPQQTILPTRRALAATCFVSNVLLKIESVCEHAKLLSDGVKSSRRLPVYSSSSAGASSISILLVALVPSLMASHSSISSS